MYVTDTLKAVVGASTRYLDWIEQKPKDTRTGEEIVADVIKNAGLKLVRKRESN